MKGPLLITGPPTHSVGSQTSNDGWCLSSSVTLPAGRSAGRPPSAWAVNAPAAGYVGGRATDTPQWASTVTSR